VEVPGFGAFALQELGTKLTLTPETNSTKIENSDRCTS